MIEFRDFVPEIKDNGGFLNERVWEELSESLTRANEWIRAHDINVVSVETVVLPGMRATQGKGSSDPEHGMGVVSAWHQFIRVWYRTD